ncbi:MAG: NosD domain-containing protein [Candidatus Bathyarchaeia archaeon]
MGSKSITMALLLVTLFLISMVTFHPASVKAKSRTLVVPDQCPTIQGAIDKANYGDTIYVKNGVYHEELTLYKPVNLIGESPQNTVIDGGNIGDVIQATGICNIAISGFTIENAGTSKWTGQGFPDSCIYLLDCANVSVTNNYIREATVGLLPYASSALNCQNNTVTDTTTMGMLFYSCENSTISDSQFYDCGIIGAHLDGNSSGCKIENNYIANCDEGIEIERSKGNLVSQNSLFDNNMGMGFHNDTGNLMQFCTVENNSIGIAFLQANGNTIYCNSFIDNKKQVDLSFNTNLTSSSNWDNGTVGNYWSDYNGQGTYVINENNVDHHPLTQQVNISPTFSPTIPELTPIAIVSLLLSVFFVAVMVRHRKTANSK